MRDRRGAIAQSDLDTLAEEVALHDVDGVGLRPMVELIQQSHPELPITQALVKSLKRHPKYKELHLEASVRFMEQAKLKWNLGTAKLADKALKALDVCLDEEGPTRMKAVAVVFSSITEKDGDGPKQAQALQIIMPGGVVPSKGEKPG